VHGLGQSLFGTPTRRGLTLLVAGASFYGVSHLIQRYIQTQCTSAGVSFVLLILWFALAILTGLVTAMSLSNIVVGPGYLKELLTDDMAKLDARIGGGLESLDEDDFDESIVLGRSSGGKFAVYFITFAIAHVLTANALGQGFLQRYMHPGLAMINLRNDDEATRRRGLQMLTTGVDLRVTAEVEQVILTALNDPSEGVTARAAHAAGLLEIQAAALPMMKLVDSRPVLAFQLMIALGQLRPGAASEIARPLAQSKAAQAEPVALAYMLGMLKIAEIGQLRKIFLTETKNEDARVAALWALGQLRDDRLLDILAKGLEDPSLPVQCSAIAALGHLISTDTAPALMGAFERISDHAEQCPEIVVPVQEGGALNIIVKYRLKMFAIIRALATTDHPELIRWLVKHQNDSKDYNTKILMTKLYEKLLAKDKRGELTAIRRRLRNQKLSQETDKSDTGDVVPNPAAKSTKEAGDRGSNP
jgi:hypothetical protein